MIEGKLDLNVQVEIGHDEANPNEWYVRTIITKVSGEVIKDEVTGPFPSDAIARAAADDLIHMLEEATGKNGPLHERFVAIANSDKPPGEQLTAVRDLLKPFMLFDFRASIATGKMCISEPLGELLSHKDFHEWAGRDGIKAHVAQAFLDIGKELKR